MIPNILTLALIQAALVNNIQWENQTFLESSFTFFIQFYKYSIGLQSNLEEQVYEI